MNSSINLASLSAVVQALFGWSGRHLHEFRIGGRSFGVAYPGAIDLPPDHEEKLSLGMVLGGKIRFSYLYDFGAGWVHRIVASEVSDAEATAAPLIFSGGEGLSPPENSGGPVAFQQLLKQQRTVCLDESRAGIASQEPATLRRMDIDAIQRRLSNVPLKMVLEAQR